MAAQAANVPSFGWVFEPAQSNLMLIHTWVKANEPLISVGLLMLIVLMLLFEYCLVFRRTKDGRRARRGWRDWMRQKFGDGVGKSRKARQDFLKTFHADGITDYVEDGVYEGIITRQEADAWYARQAEMCGLKDLCRRTDQKKLKTALLDKHIEKVEAKKAKTEIGGVFLKSLKRA